jgi:antitoxin component YwqK of YwqJK toxin-antitoxin module
MKHVTVIFLLLAINSVMSQEKSPCGNNRKKSSPRMCLNCYDQVAFDEEINTYVLTKDGFTPFNGTCQTWNRAGYVLEELTCVNGKRDGVDTSYYGSGCVQSTQGYILGIKNGKHQVYFDSTNQLRKEENYLRGKLHGLVHEYNRSGDTLLYLNYANDIPHGTQRTYYPNGKCFKIISYKNGLLDGPHLTYSEAGKIELKLNYKDGKKDGVFIFYHDNEVKAGEETWSLDQKNGSFITYNEEGKILKEGYYKKNLPVGDHKTFDSKGKIIHQTIYDKKGIKQYEMEIDEYGDKKVLYDVNKTEKSTEITADDDPKDITPGDQKKNNRKKRKERRAKEKS